MNTVRSGKVDHGELRSVHANRAGDLFYGDSGVVGYFLTKPGELIEDGRLAGIGVSGNRKTAIQNT